jgi:hypothetical protein
VLALAKPRAQSTPPLHDSLAVAREIAAVLDGERYQMPAVATARAIPHLARAVQLASKATTPLPPALVAEPPLPAADRLHRVTTAARDDDFLLAACLDAQPARRVERVTSPPRVALAARVTSTPALATARFPPRALAARRSPPGPFDRFPPLLGFRLRFRGGYS